MSDTNQKRQALRALYGEAWKKRVDKMSEAQVVAIFLKMQREGKIK